LNQLLEVSAMKPSVGKPNKREKPQEQLESEMKCYQKSFKEKPYVLFDVTPSTSISASLRYNLFNVKDEYRLEIPLRIDNEFPVISDLFKKSHNSQKIEHENENQLNTYHLENEDVTNSLIKEAEKCMIALGKSHIARDNKIVAAENPMILYNLGRNHKLKVAADRAAFAATIKSKATIATKPTRSSSSTHKLSLSTSLSTSSYQLPLPIPPDETFIMQTTNCIPQVN
jgi:hypothetical protein